jgi:hypothetical protein
MNNKARKNPPIVPQAVGMSDIADIRQAGLMSFICGNSKMTVVGPFGP